MWVGWLVAALDVDPLFISGFLDLEFFGGFVLLVSFCSIFGCCLVDLLVWRYGCFGDLSIHPSIHPSIHTYIHTSPHIFPTYMNMGGMLCIWHHRVRILCLLYRVLQMAIMSSTTHLSNELSGDCGHIASLFRLWSTHCTV